MIADVRDEFSAAHGEAEKRGGVLTAHHVYIRPHWRKMRTVLYDVEEAVVTFRGIGQRLAIASHQLAFWHCFTALSECLDLAHGCDGCGHIQYERIRAAASELAITVRRFVIFSVGMAIEFLFLDVS
jgi:hypothetical protein